MIKATSDVAEIPGTSHTCSMHVEDRKEGIFPGIRLPVRLTIK